MCSVRCFHPPILDRGIAIVQSSLEDTDERTSIYYMRRRVHVRSDLETDVDVEKFGDEHNERDRNDQRARSRVFQTRRVALWFDSGHGFVLYTFWALNVVSIEMGTAVLRSRGEV